MKWALVALAAAAAADDVAPPRLCYLIYVHNNATLEGAAELLRKVRDSRARAPPSRDDARTDRHAPRLRTRVRGVFFAGAGVRPREHALRARRQEVNPHGCLR